MSMGTHPSEISQLLAVHTPSLAVNGSTKIIQFGQNVIGVFSLMTINGDTTVRELLTEHPGAFDVLASHGMCQDCRDNPPLVPLQHFALKHCGGNLRSLIEQIETALLHDQRKSPHS